MPQYLSSLPLGKRGALPILHVRSFPKLDTSRTEIGASEQDTKESMTLNCY